jgi:hypothetical protein
MTPLAFALAGITLFSMVRLLWWQASASTRSRPWRIAVLLILQPLIATLLWLTLEPPRSASIAGTLVVATAGAPRLAALGTGDTLVALPEAPDLPGAVRVPDLATALRTRRPARLRIIGHGLTPRDQFPTGLPLAFDPPPLPPGLVSLTPPPIVAPGASFRVAGSVHGVPGGHVALIDPAGSTVATMPLPVSGDFSLATTARAAGPADFTLKVTNRNRRLVETAAVPVVAVEATPPKILVIAGAAGPDLKYLRRWAKDAGVQLGASIAAGSSLDVGDTPPRVDAGSLAGLDLLILDERSWAAMPAASRASVLAAVRGGLGLLLRVTGPLLDATRRDWSALGFRTDDAALALRLANDSHTLTRIGLAATRSDTAPLLRDAAGTPVALWRGMVRGRIGLWPVTDLYTLVLAGDASRHAAQWSDVFATLARPQAGSQPQIAADATLGRRLVICNLRGPASVRHPDGTDTAIIVDAGCAAFWPRLIGWHELRTPSPVPFAVMAIGSARAAAQARSATLALAAPNSAAVAASGSRGASLPWFLGWAAASALLWWLERSRRGRDPIPNSPPE